MTHFQSNRPYLPEILSLHGKWRATKEAVIFDQTTKNWGEFTRDYHNLAHGLIAHGINKGDCIGILMSNGYEMIQSLMAVMAAGAVSVPINLSVNDDGLIAMLSDASVKAIICTDDQAERINQNQHKLPKSCQLLIVDSDAALPWKSLQSLSQDQPSHLPDIELTDEDLLNIIYSSGTTGLPKGITHNHAGRRDWAYDLAIALRYHCNSRTLLTIGLYSNISWVAMLTTLLAGGTVVIHKHFDADTALSAVQGKSITHTAMVPIQFQRMIELLERQPNKFDTSSMQAMMSCGSPLHADLKKAIFNHFDCGIIELYGLTEGVITTIEKEESEGRWSSVGRPLIGTDIRIIDEQDKELSNNQSGEIVSRGRITMPGYLNRPEANEDASYIDEDGQQWLRTGDIGYLDEDNFLYIVDRKKDMILSGGQNIYPQDIEAILIQHRAVNDVAVIAAKSNKWGETPIALVVLEQDQELDELKGWANQQLGKQQRITDVIEIDELPRNPNGKILKRELRKKFAESTYD